MKVCTDACLFGAYIAHAPGLKSKSCLDIGTGTGLLSLMLAQENTSMQIDAVEMDELAAQQALENFNASPWKNRLHLFNTPIQKFNKFPTKHYDLIISNPPFHQNNLKSADHKRNLALHNSDLSFADLLDAVNKYLRDDGLFAALLPYHRTKEFTRMALDKAFSLSDEVNMKQSSKHSYFRTILVFSKEKITTGQKEIIIRDEQGHYTGEFATLLRNYYLYL
jgi:tRNA1Val (adenine37-N6)-methyltransferase